MELLYFYQKFENKTINYEYQNKIFYVYFKNTNLIIFFIYYNLFSKSNTDNDVRFNY